MHDCMYGLYSECAYVSNENGSFYSYRILQHTATHCNTLQHTATYCNAMQHTATHCSTLQHTATRCNTLQHTARHYKTLQHTVTHCNTQVLGYDVTRLQSALFQNSDDDKKEWPKGFPLPDVVRLIFNRACVCTGTCVCRRHTYTGYVKEDLLPDVFFVCFLYTYVCVGMGVRIYVYIYLHIYRLYIYIYIYIGVH